MNWLKFKRKRFSEDRTRECGKILGWFVTRSERLIKLRDSWFSAKSILVERLKNFVKGRALDKWWGLTVLLNLLKLRMLTLMTLSRQTMGAKIHSRKGNSPDHQLRLVKIIKWKNCEKNVDSRKVGLEAAIF